MKIGHFHTGSALFGFHGGLQVTERLEIVCGKELHFTNKNIPTGRSCRPSWGHQSGVPGDRDVSVLQSGRRDARWIRCYRCVGHHLFPDRTDPGNTDPSGKDIYRIFPVLGTILNVVALGGVSFCCIWEAVCNGYSGTEALDHTAVI